MFFYERVSRAKLHVFFEQIKYELIISLQMTFDTIPLIRSVLYVFSLYVIRLNYYIGLNSLYIHCALRTIRRDLDYDVELSSLYNLCVLHTLCRLLMSRGTIPVDRPNSALSETWPMSHPNWICTIHVQKKMNTTDSLYIVWECYGKINGIPLSSQNFYWWTFSIHQQGRPGWQS